MRKKLKVWDCRMRPMTQEEVLLRHSNDMRLRARVVVDLCDIIENDLEGFLDGLGERVLNSPCFSDLEYYIVGHEKNGYEIVIEVEGSTDDAIEFFDPDDCRAQKKHLKYKFDGGEWKGCCRLCGEK